MNLSLTDRTNEFTPEDIDDAKVVSGISYLWILFFLPLVTKPNSKFGKFHANQALLVLFSDLIISFVVGAAVKIINLITFGLISGLTGILIGAVNLVFGIIMIVCLLTAISGKAYELPFIGGIKIIK